MFETADIKKQILAKRVRVASYARENKAVLEKHRSYASLDELEKNLENAQFTLSLLNYKYECLFQKNGGGTHFSFFIMEREGLRRMLRLRPCFRVGAMPLSCQVRCYALTIP